MNRIFLLTTAMIIAGNIAHAEMSTTAVADDYVAQGYSKVEVQRGQTQIQVEAVRGTEKITVIYDIASGNVLSTQSRLAPLQEQSERGVQIRSGAQDFSQANDNDHGGNDDNQNGNDGDRGGNDDNGNDHGGNDNNQNGNDGDHGGNDNNDNDD
jgi:hypothetical protein